jgi:hypothetical protein
MTENYPFTGTGNLFRFCQGLARIGIQNKVVVLFDNDTAGSEMYEKAKGLELPPNMKVTKLPDLEVFKNFKTIGPSGVSVDDVNGKAVSIELFLDINRKDKSLPMIRWTAYNPNMTCYQGELVNKEAYIRDFLKANISKENYNLSYLSILWEHLYFVCTGKRT